MSAAPRTGTIQIRVSDLEKAQIRERALAAGKTVSDYVRDRALGRRQRTSPVAPVAVVEQPHPNVAAEIAEAKMPDDAAREAFVERRTRQLQGQGRTSIVARREAEAEWRMRGS